MTLEMLLARVQDEGEKRGVVIYDLCHRNAGWGVMWHEAPREKPPVGNDNNAWRTGLILYQYRPTLREALEAELARFARSEPVRPVSQLGVVRITAAELAPVREGEPGVHTHPHPQGGAFPCNCGSPDPSPAPPEAP